MNCCCGSWCFACISSVFNAHLKTSRFYWSVIFILVSLRCVILRKSIKDTFILEKTESRKYGSNLLGFCQLSAKEKAFTQTSNGSEWTLYCRILFYFFSHRWSIQEHWTECLPPQLQRRNHHIPEYSSWFWCCPDHLPEDTFFCWMSAWYMLMPPWRNPAAGGKLSSCLSYRIRQTHTSHYCPGWLRLDVSVYTP